MRKFRLLLLIIMVLIFVVIGCKKSDELINAAASNSTISGTYTISTTGSSYTVNGVTTPINIGDAYCQSSYTGSFNVTLDENGNANITGEFNGTGTIVFTMNSPISGGKITVTLQGNTSLPAQGVTLEYTISKENSNYKVRINGEEKASGAINTEGVIISANYSYVIENIKVNNSGNATVSGSFKGFGAITLNVPSGVNNGTISVVLSGDNTSPVVGLEISINKDSVSYTYNGNTNSLPISDAKVVTPSNLKLTVSLDSSGNGEAKGTFTGKGTIKFEIKSGVKDGKIVVELTGDGTAGTGTVTGTLNANATITLNQSDGTSQTTSTTTSTPNYTFNNVPEGEATVVYNAGGQQTTQTVQVNAGETTQINPFGSTQELLNSLKVSVYAMPSNSTSVSQINLNNQLGATFYSREINVPNRSFNEGFPGVTDRFEWFGIIYEGVIYAPVSGEYTFELISDDGAVLWINNIKVVDNDGVHAVRTKTGKITLTKGQAYPILLKYFQGPRYHIALVFNVTIPGQAKKLFNMNDFKR